MGFKIQPPKRFVKTKQQLDHEKELEAKARYALRTKENGEVDSQRSFMLFWLDQYSWIGLTIIAIGILSLIRGLI